jgi:hypothetical protein
MVHVSSTMWRIENQPSNSNSCSANALRSLVLVAGILYWGLRVTSSFSNWACILKGCFERGIFWRAKSRMKGIEDFNLEHYFIHLDLCNKNEKREVMAALEMSKASGYPITSRLSKWRALPTTLLHFFCIHANDSPSTIYGSHSWTCLVMSHKEQESMDTSCCYHNSSSTLPLTCYVVHSAHYSWKHGFRCSRRGPLYNVVICHSIDYINE